MTLESVAFAGGFQLPRHPIILLLSSALALVALMNVILLLVPFEIILAKRGTRHALFLSYHQ